MLRLNRFRYHRPTSAAEALALLADYGTEAMLMAGGTDVLPNIKHRVATPCHLISIRDLPELSGFDPAAPVAWLGATTRLSDLEHDPRVRAIYPALADSARLISVPQVRGVATLGGNICLDTRCNYYNQSYEWRQGIGFCMKKDSPICHVAPGGDRCWAVASADTVPVLIALRAEAEIISAERARLVPLDAIYQDDGLQPTTLTFGEIVRGVRIPAPDGYQTVYQKFRLRQSFDFPLVGIAVSLRRDDSGTVEDVRIVMTAVASFPERARAAEQLLRGACLTEETITAAGAAIFRQAKPMDNTAGTIFHRKRMARVLVERALRRLAGVSEQFPAAG